MASSSAPGGAVMTHKRKGQHFTKRTVSAARWCNKCRKMTPHRVDDGRPGGPCLTCMEQRPVPSVSSVVNDRALVWVPMACFCAIYAFPHYHAEGEIRAHYPGPL